MSRIRRLLLATVCGAALLAAVETTAEAAGIPVVDLPALAQWVVSIANEVKSYALQLQQYLLQVKQYIGEELSWVKQAAQYATELEHYYTDLQMFISFVHNPSLGAAVGLLSAAGLSNSLPINPSAVLGLVDGFKYGTPGIPEIPGILTSLSGLAGYSYDQAHVYTPTDGSWASQQVIARANGIAGEKAAAQATYQDLRTHQALLQALRDHLAQATTPKDVQDTQAQIELETVWTNNEAAQLQAIAAAYQAQTDSITQRDNERLAHDIEQFLARAPTT
jgi:conjugal transfer/entry exclusion protein